LFTSLICCSFFGVLRAHSISVTFIRTDYCISFNMVKMKFDSEDVSELLRLYVEAKQSGKLCKYYVGRFQHKRDDYIDDLPEVDVRTLATLDDKSHFLGDNYKCRGNYIVGLSLDLQAAVNDGVINDCALASKINGFSHHNFSFQRGEFTTKEEMVMINRILADVIQHLGE